MKIFLTGAKGYLGGAIARELTAAGHNVTGLARSASSTRKLQAARVVPHSGSLADAGSLAAGARSADAVIHAALDAAAKAPHEADIEAAGSFLRALAGTGKAFVYTSGLTVLGDTGGIMADEDTPPNPIPFSAWRPALERTVLAAAGREVRSIVIRPGWVYGRAAAEPSGCLSKEPGRTVSPGLSATAETTGPSCTSMTSPACMCWPSSSHRPALCCTLSGHQLPRSRMSPPQPPGPP
jgi:nucleoside-diphosphate-sugar epimerase